MPERWPRGRMRAASLTQPWCGTMAAGIKLIENRSQPLVSRESFGEAFGLHATRVYDETIVNRILEIAPELKPRTDLYGFFDDPWYKLGQITSAVIAVSSFVDVVKASGFDEATQKYTYDAEDLERIPQAQRRWMFGRYCYLITEPIVIKHVRSRGWQGFWTMDEDIDRKVREAYWEKVANG